MEGDSGTHNFLSPCCIPREAGTSWGKDTTTFEASNQVWVLEEDEQT